MEVYKIEHVKEIAEKIEVFFERELRSKGYTYPEIIVAMQQALYTAVYRQSKRE